MKYDEFSSIYIRLYKYFHSRDKIPDPEQIAEYYDFLQFLKADEFAKICRHIKESEEKLPSNLVAYCNNYRREMGERSVGGDKAPNPNKQVVCAACQDTGFIGVVCIVDPKTGKKTRKVREVSDHGIEYTFRCTCSVGQRMAACIPFATEQEVIVSAKMNGSSSISNEARFV